MEKLQITENAEALTARLASLIDTGRLGVARPLLSAVRRLAPPSARLAELGARLAMREGQFTLAREELDEAVALAPKDAGLRKCRADLRMQMNDKDGAARDAAEAVILDSGDPAAKALLGILMLELGRPTDAIACLSEAIAANPSNPAYREGLAAAQEAAGDAAAALCTFNAGIAASPGRVELRTAAVMLSLRRRDFTMAVQLAEEARVAGVADACLYGLKGHALSSLGRHAEATEAYADALKLGPNDPYVRHLVAASGAIPGSDRAPVEYLRAVFDGYADRFELHLLSLGYRIPGLIRAALAEHPAIVAGGPLGPALDLGCGTGLAAVAVSDLPIGPIVGVDIAPRMLACAATKQIYAELREADLMQLLTEDEQRWRLIMAADVLCYFGALRDVLAAVHARLEPGGWFIFSVEELLPDYDGTLYGNGNWALQRQGRYAHTEDYVANVARDLDFTIRTLERQTIRYEANASVAGIFACTRARIVTAAAALKLLENGDPTGALELLGDTGSPDDIEPAQHAIRGMVLLASDRPAQALSALRTAVALGDTSPSTTLNLALAEQKAGSQECAVRLMEALELRLPNWDEPALRRAELLRAMGNVAEAEQFYGRVLGINPRREEALLGLAGLLLLRGDGDGARVLLLRCCGVAPLRADAWDALGLALTLTGDTAMAGSAFAEAQRLSPRTLEYALHRVDAAMAAGDESALLAWLDVASHDDPLDPVLLTARGVLLERLGRCTEAIDALESATALAPRAMLPAAFLGRYLAHANRLREAEGALRRAIDLDPENLQLRNDCAVVLMRMQRHADAHTELLAMLDAGGEHINVLCNLANTIACLGSQDEAVALARRAIEIAPDAVLPRRVLCNTLPYCDWVTGAGLLAALKDCSDRLPRQAPPAFVNLPDPDRPLVIGLLSGSLKTHPVGWLTIAGFETLDSAEFALVCLAQNGAHDPIARRFRAVAHEWHDVDALSDVALAQLARERGIDILIDLGGYGDGARMPACAFWLAPVQIKWVGAQNHSSGLAEMDWIITDRWETPPELEHVYSEQPLRLPDGYVCYSPPPYALDVVPLPALANGHISFGCFNNLAKITPRVIATWCTVLHRVAGSRLVLKTNQFSDAPTAERILAAFTAHGIAPTRIDLRGPSGHRAFMGEYNQIDIVLDPFPYSGGLTTCEALWMGVPTVTVPGETFASRHSMSHLSNAGLSDWVAPDLASYVELAVARASDIPALAVLRSGLRAQVKASPLCDAPRFGRNLGAALRHAWRDWCAGR